MSTTARTSSGGNAAAFWREAGPGCVGVGALSAVVGGATGGVKRAALLGGLGLGLTAAICGATYLVDSFIGNKK